MFLRMGSPGRSVKNVIKYICIFRLFFILSRHIISLFSLFLLSSEKQITLILLGLRCFLWKNHWVYKSIYGKILSRQKYSWSWMRQEPGSQTHTSEIWFSSTCHAGPGQKAAKFKRELRYCPGFQHPATIESLAPTNPAQGLDGSRNVLASLEPAPRSPYFTEAPAQRGVTGGWGQGTENRAAP